MLTIQIHKYIHFIRNHAKFQNISGQVPHEIYFLFLCLHSAHCTIKWAIKFNYPHTHKYTLISSPGSCDSKCGYSVAIYHGLGTHRWNRLATSAPSSFSSSLCCTGQLFTSISFGVANNFIDLSFSWYFALLVDWCLGKFV